jgi:hypothetical protein
LNTEHSTLSRTLSPNVREALPLGKRATVGQIYSHPRRAPMVL